MQDLTFVWMITINGLTFSTLVSLEWFVKSLNNKILPEKKVKSAVKIQKHVMTDNFKVKEGTRWEIRIVKHLEKWLVSLQMNSYL